MSVEEMLTAVCAFVLFCTQAIPDTQLTIRKYADTKFEYLVCTAFRLTYWTCMYMLYAQLHIQSMIMLSISKLKDGKFFLKTWLPGYGLG